jgi:hypothetical protein
LHNIGCVYQDHLTLHRVWKFERKVRDYMAPYNIIQNVDEKKKDTFEKVESSPKLVKKNSDLRR